MIYFQILKCSFFVRASCDVCSLLIYSIQPCYVGNLKLTKIPDVDGVCLFNRNAKTQNPQDNHEDETKVFLSKKITLEINFPTNAIKSFASFCHFLLSHNFVLFICRNSCYV